MTLRIADASDIPVWGWHVWGVVGLALIVAVAVVLYLDATHPFPTPRDAAPAPVPSTTEPVRSPTCSVPFCDQDVHVHLRVGLEMWRFCTEHGLPYLVEPKGGVA